MSSNSEREQWGSRIGLILAVAGNAVGLGNFLRFPVQAAQNGGGAFMIPYFIFFLILGIPMMWIEWGIGRHGGKFNHGSAPGMFDVIWKNKLAKYFGSIGLLISLIILIYYTYVTSWTLAYSFFSISKSYFGLTDFEQMKNFLYSFQGRFPSEHFNSINVAYSFFIVTFIFTFWVLYKGISKGIENLAKIAMPMLFLFAIVIAIRVLTLGTPDPSIPENSISTGLGFIWNPDFSQLSNPSIWMAAAGQIFFTLSVGMGTIQAYASYVKPKDDIALSGLTTAATNEVAEVVLGGTIAIPIAVAFFGVAMTTQMALGGSYDLGFASLPLVFQQIPFGEFFGFLWFVLLFFAGITSSVAMGQPIISFLEDEFGFSRKKAVTVIGTVAFISIQFIIFYLKYGFLDELDFWAGTFGLVVFALIETVLFIWVFGADKAWSEINEGADIKIPKIFYFIMKFVTPFVLIIITVWWIYNSAIPQLLLSNVPQENIPYIWGARIFMITCALGLILMVKAAWKKNEV